MSLSLTPGWPRAGRNRAGVYCQQRQSALGFTVHTGWPRGVGLSPRFIGLEPAGPWVARGGGAGRQGMGTGTCLAPGVWLAGDVPSPSKSKGPCLVLGSGLCRWQGGGAECGHAPCPHLGAGDVPRLSPCPGSWAVGMQGAGAGHRQGGGGWRDASSKPQLGLRMGAVAVGTHPASPRWVWDGPTHGEHDQQVPTRSGMGLMGGGAPPTAPRGAGQGRDQVTQRWLRSQLRR